MNRSASFAARQTTCTGIIFSWVLPTGRNLRRMDVGAISVFGTTMVAIKEFITTKDWTGISKSTARGGGRRSTAQEKTLSRGTEKVTYDTV